jgi:hypothetical protein
VLYSVQRESEKGKAKVIVGFRRKKDSFLCYYYYYGSLQQKEEKILDLFFDLFYYLFNIFYSSRIAR